MSSRLNSKIAFFSDEKKAIFSTIGFWRFIGKGPYFFLRKIRFLRAKYGQSKNWSSDLFWHSASLSKLSGKWLYASSANLNDSEFQKTKEDILQRANKYKQRIFYSNGCNIHLDKRPCNGRWDVDPITGKQWPVTSPFVPVDYSVGDVRYVWEIGRLQHLVCFAQAWRLTKDVVWWELILEHIEDFFGQNHYERGIQWRDGLQISVRLFTFIAVADLCYDVNEAFVAVLNNVIVAHVCALQRQLSPVCEITNNHSISEASGLILSGLYLDEHPLGKKVLAKGLKRLKRELERQIYSDGMPYEGCLPYVRFDLDFLLLLMKAFQCLDENVPSWLSDNAKRMATALQF